MLEKLDRCLAKVAAAPRPANGGADGMSGRGASVGTLYPRVTRNILSAPRWNS